MAVRGFCVVGPIWSARSPTFSQSGLRAGLLHLADGDHGGRARKMAGSEIGDIADGGKKI